MKRSDVTNLIVIVAVRMHELEIYKLSDNPTARVPDCADILVKMTGAPLKVCLAALNRADRAGVIDWGTCVERSWLTDTGRKLYNQLVFL